MLIEIEGARFTVSAEDEGFWRLVNPKQWEPATFRAIAPQITQQTTFFDFGAWIGPISLFAASLGAKVFAFEPDPVAARKLRENIALNPEFGSRIQVFEKAVWPVSKRLILGARHTQGDSMSSVLHTKSEITWEVDVVTPSDIAALAPEAVPLFLKIDIEGCEYEVVPALEGLLARPEVAALVSFHPRFAVGGHPRWHKTIPITKRVFECFKEFNLYKVHKNSFRRAILFEILNNVGLAFFETRKTYLFRKGKGPLV